MENKTAGKGKRKYQEKASLVPGVMGDISAPKYSLELYIAGMTPRSIMAITNTRKICREQLKGQCELEIFDIYQKPEMAKTRQIIAAPTLIKRSPLPLRRLIGDLSQTERVLQRLDIIAV